MRNNERGNFLIEQAYMIVFLAVLAIGATYNLGTNLNSQFQSAGESLNFRNMCDSMSQSAGATGGGVNTPGSELTDPCSLASSGNSVQ